MDPIQKRELKRQAWMRLAAQKRRAGLLRGRVVALSLVCFALLWGIVFVQMATGNDPVLSAKQKSNTGRTTASVKQSHHHKKRETLELEPEVRASGEVVEPEPEVEFEEFGPPNEAEVEPEFEEVEAEPEFEEAAPEPEFEEVEPEFVEEEPLVTSQS
ncbi:MAG: hypothetical protein JST59_10705 [Actinobacteria bacterium]|nr:hypothetical protein [Actinomycetota bacterium]